MRGRIWISSLNGYTFRWPCRIIGTLANPAVGSIRFYIICIHDYLRVATLPPSSTERVYQHAPVYYNFNFVRRDQLRYPTFTSCTWTMHYNVNYVRRDLLRQRLHRVPRRHLHADCMPRINSVHVHRHVISRKYTSVHWWFSLLPTTFVCPLIVLTICWNKRPLMALWCLFLVIFFRFIDWFLQDTLTYSLYEVLYMYCMRMSFSIHTSYIIWWHRLLRSW